METTKDKSFFHRTESLAQSARSTVTPGLPEVVLNQQSQILRSLPSAPLFGVKPLFPTGTSDHCGGYSTIQEASRIVSHANMRNNAQPSFDLLSGLASFASAASNSTADFDKLPDVYSGVLLPPPSPILLGERSFFKGLFPCFGKQRGGGVETSSSDSEETQSLKEMLSGVTREEEEARDRYYKLKRQKRSLVDILKRKTKSKEKTKQGRSLDCPNSGLTPKSKRRNQLEDEIIDEDIQVFSSSPPNPWEDSLSSSLPADNIDTDPLSHVQNHSKSLCDSNQAHSGGQLEEVDEFFECQTELQNQLPSSVHDNPRCRIRVDESIEEEGMEEHENLAQVQDSSMQETTVSFLIGENFSSYAQFENKLETYKMINNVRTNKIDCPRSKKTDNVDMDKFPYMRVRVVCKHFGKIKSRSTGQRPNQMYQATECPFEVSIRFNRKANAYVVKKFCDTHVGHAQTPMTYNMHPEGRHLTEEEQKMYIDDMYIKMEVSVANVKERILNDTGKMLTTQDIINYKQKRLMQDLLSDIEKTVKKLQNAKVQDPMATVKIIYCDANLQDSGPEGAKILKAIFFQSGRMKQLFQQHGRLILIDGTHSLTNKKYICIPLHVVDNHFKTSLVGWSFVSNDGACVLGATLEIFSDANKDCISQLQYVVLDKSFAEIRAIQDVFPDVDLVICRWHGMNAVQKKTFQVLGTHNSKLTSHVIQQFKNMVYASTETEYMTAWQNLCSTRTDNAIKFQELLDYIDKNWNEYKQKFAFYCLKAKGLYECYSNNRCEGFNSHLKRTIKKKSPMHEVVDKLFMLEKDQINRSLWSTYHSTQKRLQPTNTSCPYVEEIIQTVHGKVSNESLKRLIEEGGKIRSVQHYEVRMEKDAKICTRVKGQCSFNSSVCLPCRHMFYTRKNNNEPLLDLDTIPRQWKLDATSLLPEATAKVTSNTTEQESIFENRPCTSRRARYNEHQPLLREIGSILSEMDPAEKRSVIDQLESVVHDANRSQHVEDTVLEGIGTLLFSPHKVNRRMRTGGDSQTWQSDKQKRGEKAKDRSQTAKISASLDGQPIALEKSHKSLVDWYKFQGAARNWDAEDFQILMDRTRTGVRAYLTDAHLIYAMTLLQKQFPEIGGLQEPYMYRNDQRGLCPVDPTKPYLQLSHSGGAHWVCLSNINVDGGLTSNDTVILYDSMIILNPKNNREPNISPSVFSQVAQMLKSTHFPEDRTFNVKVLPCSQQRTSTDCGLYAIANAVTLAYGESPSAIIYTGDMRQQFYDMIVRKELTMFQHLNKNTNDGNHRFMVQGNGGLGDKCELKPMEVTFDTTCYCHLPRSWGDLIECNECKRDVHQECHLIGVTRQKNSIGDTIDVFLCYDCRKPGEYEHQIKKGSPDQAAIEKACQDIGNLRSSALTRCYESVLALKQAVPITVQEYEKLEEVMCTFDINKVIHKQGSLYASIKNYYSRYVGDIQNPVDFESLSIPQKVYLSVLLICDSQKIVCRPFWPWEADDLHGKDLQIVLQDFTQKKLIKQLDDKLNRMQAKTTKLLHKNENFRKTRDEVSFIRAELKDSFSKIEQAHKSLEEADAKKSNRKTIMKKDSILQILKDLSIKNVQCRENLNYYLERQSEL